MEKIYSASALAEEFGITPRAIRFYETKKLLFPQRVGNTRAFTYRDRARLQLILRGKRLGFSLSEIREYLELYVVDTKQSGQLRKLECLVRERIRSLQQQREDIEVTLLELHEIDAQVKSALAHDSESAQCARPA